MRLGESRQRWGRSLRSGAFALALVVIHGATACTTTLGVSTTNIPRDRSRSVSASTKRWVILGLVFDNDEVLTLPDRLKDKCPGGAVRGITTHHAMTNYFLGLVMTRQVLAQGFCVKGHLVDQGAAQDPVYAEGEGVEGGDGSEGEVL